MIGARRLSLLLEQLLHEESDKKVVQLTRCRLRLGTWALRRLSEPAEGHLLWLRDSHPKLVKQGFKVKDEVDNSQLSILAHKNLCSQHLVEIGNIAKVKVGRHVSFICENSEEAKSWVEKTNPQLEESKVLKKKKGEGGEPQN